MPEVSSSKYLVQAGWNDVPHLDEAEKARQLASTPPYLRKARSMGIPSLGSGAIYPIDEEEVVCDPFKIPAYWPKLYGLDVGWKRTAGLWIAHDRDNDIAYAYTEHYRGEAEPSVHAAAIKARGEWIPGAIDPASRGRSQIDGRRLLSLYEASGLHLHEAENSVEAGLYEVYLRLSTGRLKFFRTLQNLLFEYRIYRRDEKGKIIKENDHLMDALRYAIMSLMLAIVQPMVAGGPTSSVADPRAGY